MVVRLAARLAEVLGAAAFFGAIAIFTHVVVIGAYENDVGLLLPGLALASITWFAGSRPALRWLLGAALDAPHPTVPIPADEAPAEPLFPLFLLKLTPLAAILTLAVMLPGALRFATIGARMEAYRDQLRGLTQLGDPERGTPLLPAGRVPDAPEGQLEFAWRGPFDGVYVVAAPRGLPQRAELRDFRVRGERGYVPPQAYTAADVGPGRGTLLVWDLGRGGAQNPKEQILLEQREAWPAGGYPPAVLSHVDLAFISRTLGSLHDLEFEWRLQRFDDGTSSERRRFTFVPPRPIAIERQRLSVETVAPWFSEQRFAEIQARLPTGFPWQNATATEVLLRLQIEIGDASGAAATLHDLEHPK